MKRRVLHFLGDSLVLAILLGLFVLAWAITP